MKALQFFESRSKQGKIALSDEFKKKLEALDFDIDDVWVNLFDQEFLTRERAVADPKVIDKLRAENLDAVDAIIKDLGPMMTEKDKTEFLAETKTFNKLKIIKDAWARKLEEVKTENPSSDDKVKELQKVADGYVKQLSTQKTEFENTQKELQKKFESEKQGMKLDWTLDKKLGEYTFADEYKEVKPHLTKGVIDKIKSENVLVFGEDGQIQIHEKLESGATKQKFNGNDPVTLEKLLEEPLKPFLKKNNAGNGVVANNGNGAGNGSQGRPNLTQHPEKDRSKMTLKELNRMQM